MAKNKNSKNSIPPEWIDLFKCVADLCDGVPYREIKKDINDAYEKIMDTKLGQQIYNHEVNARHNEVFGKE